MKVSNDQGSQKHTIFAVNPWMLKGKGPTDMKNQSGFMRSDLNTLYFPKKLSNNWFDPKLLAKKGRDGDLLGQNLRQTKKQLIKEIERGLPDMKAQHEMKTRTNKIFDEASFRKSLSVKKPTKREETTKDDKIRKVSVLSINSTHSLQDNSDSPQLNYKNQFNNNHKKTHHDNIFMPVTTISKQDFDNSHYNNQKYDNKRFHTDNGPDERDHQYEKQIKNLKSQLKKSEIIINTMKIKQLQGEVERLKEKDKKYDEIISSLMKEKEQEKEREKEREKEIKKKDEDQREKKLKEEQSNQSKIKRASSLGNNQKEPEGNLALKRSESIQKEPKTEQMRSKTQMRDQQKTQVSNQPKKPLNYHVLADHLKQIETQKQFGLINPQKTRQKLQVCYHQLKKQTVPEITINPFRIPKVPNPPKHDQSLDDYLRLAKELCKCLNYQIQEIDIVIRRYRNCVSFKLLEKDQVVIWGFDGKLYVGKWVQQGEGEGRKEGPGMEFTSNYCFKGDFKDNKKAGQGVAQFYNGNVYEGEWQSGKMEGKGIYFDKSTSTYFQGDWIKGQMRGRGIIKYNKKHFFTGEISNFASSGRGTEFFQNGDIYQGSFEKGRPSGYGIFYSNTGEFYVGNFKNSLKHGTGLHLSNRFNEKLKTEQYYYGQFYQGMRSGYGIQRTEDNNYYLGYFYNNVPHGPGILQNSSIFQKDKAKNNLIKLSGIWKNGKIIVKNRTIEPSQKGQSQDFSQKQ